MQWQSVGLIEKLYAAAREKQGEPLSCAAASASASQASYWSFDLPRPAVRMCRSSGLARIQYRSPAGRATKRRP